MHKNRLLSRLQLYSLPEINRDIIGIGLTLMYLGATRGWKHVGCALTLLMIFRKRTENPPRVSRLMFQLVDLARQLEQSRLYENAATFLPTIRRTQYRSYQLIFCMNDNSYWHRDLEMLRAEFFEYLDAIGLAKHTNTYHDQWMSEIQPYLDHEFTHDMLYTMIGYLIFFKPPRIK